MNMILQIVWGLGFCAIAALETLLTLAVLCMWGSSRRPELARRFNHMSNALLKALERI